MPKYFIISVLLLSLFMGLGKLQAQKPGDYDYIFESLEEVEKYPNYVYHLNLTKRRLDTIPAIIYTLENLETLDLSRNKISLLPERIADLKSVRSLDLSRNDITILPPQLGKLKSLKVLKASKNYIEEIPAEIGKMKSLEELVLWGNKIKKIPEGIKRAENLKTLNLRGMDLPDGLVEQLKEWLPNTNVYYTNSCNCGH